MGMIYTVFASPLGEMKLCSDGAHLTAVTFSGQKNEAKHLGDAIAGHCPVLEETKEWLTRYFAGEVPSSLPPLRPKGTDFQLRVWETLMEIPYGKTVTYGDLAKRLDCKSAQAIGGAVGRNPISVLIPCHRVIGADGRLTGYAGGVEKKAYLLNLENGLPRRFAPRNDAW